jgi:hypothetical protein
MKEPRKVEKSREIQKKEGGFRRSRRRREVSTFLFLKLNNLIARS